MNEKNIKTIGFLATALGVGVTLVTDWVNEKKMEEKIEEKVDEILDKKLNDNENEEDEES